MNLPLNDVFDAVPQLKSTPDRLVDVSTEESLGDTFMICLHLFIFYCVT